MRRQISYPSDTLDSSTEPFAGAPWRRYLGLGQLVVSSDVSGTTSIRKRPEPSPTGSMKRTVPEKVPVEASGSPENWRAGNPENWSWTCRPGSMREAPMLLTKSSAARSSVFGATVASVVPFFTIWPGPTRLMLDTVPLMGARTMALDARSRALSTLRLSAACLASSFCSLRSTLRRADSTARRAAARSAAAATESVRAFRNLRRAVSRSRTDEMPSSCRSAMRASRVRAVETPRVALLTFSSADRRFWRAWASFWRARSASRRSPLSVLVRWAATRSANWSSR